MNKAVVGVGGVSFHITASTSAYSRDICCDTQPTPQPQLGAIVMIVLHFASHPHPRPPTPSQFGAIVLRFPKRAQPAVYMGCHLLATAGAMLFNTLWCVGLCGEERGLRGH
jgi:hypothetical protein